jgi:hypothetical protein
MAGATPEPAPAAGWVEALGRLEDTLDRSLGATETMAQEPGEPPAAPPAPADGLRLLQAVLDRAERVAAEVGALLVAGSDALHRWLDEAAAARRRLEAWTARYDKVTD